MITTTDLIGSDVEDRIADLEQAVVALNTQIAGLVEGLVAATTLLKGMLTKD